jgi:MerR family mercuric resistance operon transcriptional regulator
MKTYTIGQLAKTVGVNIETVRYYERSGLLPKPPRNDSGYRQFPEEAVVRLRFTKNAQRLGFSLKEIRELLSLRLIPDSACLDIKEKAEVKIAEIDQKMVELKTLRKALKELSARCAQATPINECHFLEVLQDSGRGKL